MNLKTVLITAEWAVSGMAASYKGTKEFRMNVDDDEAEDVIDERARLRAKALIAKEGCWEPRAVSILAIRVEPMAS